MPATKPPHPMVAHRQAPRRRLIPVERVRQNDLRSRRFQQGRQIQPTQGANPKIERVKIVNRRLNQENSDHALPLRRTTIERLLALIRRFAIV